MTAMITPASLAFVDGIPYAEAYGDVYHSADGGLAQAQHVFLRGSRVVERWRARQRFAILETGFGLGLNFLATWQAWRADPDRADYLHYVAIEKHPFRCADLAQVHARWPELAGVSEELRAAWPPLVTGFHRIPLDRARVILTLVFGDIADCAGQIDAGIGFDAFYLDGFSPSKNPQMWAPPILARLGRMAAPDAMLSTYSVAASVRQALAPAGFIYERLPGFGRKPEMLAARFAPRWPLASFAEPVRSAIVIGAGIAGCSISERLCARGWHVTLVERHAQPAQEISGNRAGIVMPLLSQDDNLVSRLARAAYLYALRTWSGVGGIGSAFDGEACGVLQVASSAEDAEAQRRAVALFPDAPEFATWLNAQEVATRYGIDAAHGGWLFARGGWATPASLCGALLAACGPRLARRFSHSAMRLVRAGEDWQVLDAGGSAIAAAPHLILANGNGAVELMPAQGLPLARVRGQVTHLDARAVPTLPLVVCGDAYMTRAAGDIVSVGATYDFDDDPNLRADSQRENLEALGRTLPQLATVVTGEAVSESALSGHPLFGRALSGRVAFRCVSQDRLPLAGALPDPGTPIGGSRLRDVTRHPNLHGLLAYGSRGLIWAPFCAEMLAAKLEGEPLPIERDLAAALDPARFALKAHRRLT